MYRIDHTQIYNNKSVHPAAMAIGYFDGIHMGHKKVICTAKSIADEQGLESAVMTFDPHPSVVLGRERVEKAHITPMEDKVQVIESLGIDRLYIVTFNKGFASLTPQQFVDQFIIGFNIKHVVAGFDFSFGKKGEGTMETLPFHSRGQFKHTVINKVSIEGQKVSSTLIRTLIENGQVQDIPTFLGRHYQVGGRVIHGDNRGHTIGFPTANIHLENTYMIPQVGVYAVKMNVNGEWYDGVCNVGYKPTFKDDKPDQPGIEVHLFEFDAEIYGEYVFVKWCNRIRGEKKFSSIEELKAQIAEDVSTAKQILQHS
ncbi:bifunctional riboflavin kinase/FAD synthetase [Alkalihalobacillus berkeleyi]|uniref:Riboflavin biosynthesis protein n=1 Tax=Pseudalkalibacillus berkeleyi TaxID=1069813 RepID=A0ABS9H081_9BACL|nr:bifunctional riboflavin kinase/FAD synthetase [Pseudalkalibacillus berkeleyi]MCF6137153.1 bifunctional riboflavin kinase/FAD synthetase [Pseudalkalibacillus berkeleyi]